MDRKRWKVVPWVGASGTLYGDIYTEEGESVQDTLRLEFANQIVKDHNTAILPNEVGVFLWDGSLATAIVNPPSLVLRAWMCDWYAKEYLMDRTLVTYATASPIPSPTQEEIEAYGHNFNKARV